MLPIYTDSPMVPRIYEYVYKYPYIRTNIYLRIYENPLALIHTLIYIHTHVHDVHIPNSKGQQMNSSTIEAIKHQDLIEQQLVKAIPFPIGHISNGTIYIQVKSALGKSEWIRADDEQFKAIEKILLNKNNCADRI